MTATVGKGFLKFGDGFVADISLMIRVLLVEDDADLLDDLVFGLRHEGFETRGLTHGVAIEAELDSFAADVVVLDIMLPVNDGFEIARRLGSSHPHIGIVMLTGRGTAADHVLGLESGADIYLTKTAERRELVAAIRAVARRVALMPPAKSAWSIDTSKRTLSSPDGIEIPLTPQEFRLLQVFGRSYGGEASRRKLIEGLGHNFLDFDERRLETLMSRLRRKIASTSGHQDIIRTLRSEGYLFSEMIREL